MPPENTNVANEFEVVHTMTDYYDGPRGGIADYRGRPHIYESQFQESPDGTDVFLLQPVDDETFRLAMEDWAIWCRWERAFHNKQTTEETHPALPVDRARHDELEKMLASRLSIKPDTGLRVRGRFDIRTMGETGVTSSTQMIVYWMSNEDAV
jgi:hypothetical protein